MTPETSPRITGTITNSSLQGIEEIELIAIVLDSKQNAVAASRSFIDNLFKQSTQEFFFTWPKPFNLGLETCSLPSDIVTVIDKSGSMQSEGISPPEPFNSLVSTAQSFVKNLTNEDQASVVSFGETSQIESTLSIDKNLAIGAINNISITNATSTEKTNISDGLQNAFLELKSPRAREESKKAIILITDGITNEPTQSGVLNYPFVSAQNVAENIKSSGVSLYTIGLGKNVNEIFLKSISTSDSHYFFAPNKEALTNIYSQIAKSICARKPNVIIVIYRSI
ncbi:MAG: VWA domain-containing protein [Minisyncoccia bacterium]